MISTAILNKITQEPVKDKQRELVELLEKMPRGTNKFRYGRHFSVALRLFEALVNDDKALAETIAYLERAYAMDLFRAGCIKSFKFAATKFTRHAEKLAHIKSDDDLQPFKETYKDAMRRLRQMERITVAAHFADVLPVDMQRLKGQLSAYRSTGKKLERLFKQDDLIIPHGQRPTTFQLAQLQARRNRRSRRAEP